MGLYFVCYVSNILHRSDHKNIRILIQTSQIKMWFNIITEIRKKC